MSRRENTTVPPEIVDAIIDHCHTDRPTLASCSLVSRTWLTTSRFHLFEHPTLTSTNCDDFLALLDTPRCTVKSQVRAVTMFGTGWRHLAQAIARVVALETLTALHLLGLALEFLQPFPILPNPALKTLRMAGNRLGSFRQLSNFVALFSSIEVLELHDTEWRSDATTAAFHGPPPNLRTVKLGRCPTKVPIFDWLCESASQVDTLRLTLSRTTELRPAVRYLRSLGASLKHLELTHFLEGWATDDNANKVDFTQNIHLTSLHLHLYPRLPSSWVTVLLRRISSPVFTDFTLTLHADSKIIFRTRSHVEIDRALAEFHSGTLKRVRISFQNDRSVGDAARTAKQLFPLCERRGLLHQIDSQVIRMDGQALNALGMI